MKAELGGGEFAVGRGGDLREDCGVVKKGGLNTKVLKDVSRSFYLSLRFLPKAFRSSTSVGYLLARASDTIADAGELGVEERRELLSQFVKFVETGEGFEMPVVAGLPEGERVLMERLDECVEALEELPECQQASVRKVVGIITEGQKWDLNRFEDKGVVGLQSDEELRKYTYQVAGCVGEFWTEIGFGVEGDFARASEKEMMVWGQAYGRSLQLINILRDVPEDLENGRCYLPGAISKEELLRERQRWIKEAREGLDLADRYAEALSGKRMRFGTVLPAMIGRETLDRLEQSNWDEWEAGVKVSRKEIYRMMAQAVRFAV
ncbi:MAG: phytoene/squalene synthase family protein [Akkermansiaceae bacterium]